VKKWYASKIIWTNLIAVIAAAVQERFGYVLPAELQLLILTGINIVLRFVTRSEVVW
jgi:hypothetical protein